MGKTEPTIIERKFDDRVTAKTFTFKNSQTGVTATGQGMTKTQRIRERRGKKESLEEEKSAGGWHT